MVLEAQKWRLASVLGLANMSRTWDPMWINPIRLFHILWEVVAKMNSSEQETSTSRQVGYVFFFFFSFFFFLIFWVGGRVGIWDRWNHKYNK